MYWRDEDCFLDGMLPTDCLCVGGEGEGGSQADLWTGLPGPSIRPSLHSSSDSSFLSYYSSLYWGWTRDGSWYCSLLSSWYLSSSDVISSGRKYMVEADGFSHCFCSSTIQSVFWSCRQSFDSVGEELASLLQTKSSSYYCYYSVFLECYYYYY